MLDSSAGRATARIVIGPSLVARYRLAVRLRSTLDFLGCFVRAFLGVAGNGQQCVFFTQVHQAHALGLPPRLTDLARRGADHAAAGGDRIQLAVVVDNQSTDQPAAPTVVLDGQDALTAAALHRVLLDRGAFGIATC